jgi:plastocyanin
MSDRFGRGGIGGSRRWRRAARGTLATAALVLLHAALAGAAGGGLKGTVTSGADATPVANAVVMIDGPAARAPAGAPHAVMDQRDDTFVPHVLAVPVGTTVDFPNHDPRLHNVFSTAAAAKFDLGMYAQGETRSVTFDLAGVVPVRCNVHPKMEGYIVVHANPYVAVTDEHGVYTVRDVPAGSHRARVWHERLAEKTVPVVVREGQVQTLDVRLDKPR